MPRHDASIQDRRRDALGIAAGTKMARICTKESDGQGVLPTAAALPGLASALDRCCPRFPAATRLCRARRGPDFAPSTPASASRSQRATTSPKASATIRREASPTASPPWTRRRIAQLRPQTPETAAVYIATTSMRQSRCRCRFCSAQRPSPTDSRIRAKVLVSIRQAFAHWQPRAPVLSMPRLRRTSAAGAASAPFRA